MSASSKERANSVFSSSSLAGTGTPQRVIPASMWRITVSITSTRPFRLLSDETTSQGANGPWVNRNMSDTAPSYCARFSRLRQSSSVSFQALSGSSRRRRNRRNCSSCDMCIQSLITIIPSSANVCSKSVISSYARRHCTSVARFSTRSTSTRPYQLRSKMVMPPHPGNGGQKRHRKWWRSSSGVGAANGATCTCRGSSGSTSRLMAPPLPAASQPSKTTQTGGPRLPSLS